MKKRTYAREITKEYLKNLGVEHVSEDGLKVVVKGKEAHFIRTYSGNRPYDNVQLYDTNIRMSVPKEERTSSTGQIRVGLHILTYVWNVADKPQGYVVDHLDNNSLNNHVSNLQLLTPKENVNKEKNKPPRVVRMPKYTTLEKIENKLAYYTDLYEKAKADHDAKAAHKIRCSLSNWNAMKRQFLECPERYQKPSVSAKDTQAYHDNAQKKKDLKYEINRAHRFYQELLEAYGKDDPIVYQYWGEWKMAIVRYKMFCDEIKRAR